MAAQLVAFSGYGGTGKDEAARALIALGYQRVCFGDIIKYQLDEVISENLGFSAFTEDRAQKALIRRTLESWGEDNYENIFSLFFGRLPQKAVNTRIVRLREAQEWKRRGGIIIHIMRPDVNAETPWAEEQVDTLHRSGLIDATIYNSGSIEGLHKAVTWITLSHPSPRP